ncbi:MAG: DUF368 domain-containing protein [Saccharospirillum sp.]
MKRAWLSWFGKGLVMGIADAVPGVSGGTMALITGIYERLVSALANLHPRLLTLLWQRRWREFWWRIDGAFLLSLGLGILISLFSVLNLVHWMLETAPQLLWAFFLGLIVASLVTLGRRHRWCRLDGVLCALGTLIAVGLSLVTEMSMTINAGTLVLGGAIAISAMLLPGISGSFILLIMGLYPAVVTAVNERDLATIGLVALGCLLGLLLFSRLLNAVLRRWHDRVLAFMLGFILGATVKVWPWQYQQQWLSPSRYTELSGQPALVAGVLLAMMLGASAVVALTWHSERRI